MHIFLKIHGSWTDDAFRIDDTPQKIVSRIRDDGIWLSDEIIRLIQSGELLIDLKTIANCVNKELKNPIHRRSLVSTQNLFIEI